MFMGQALIKTYRRINRVPNHIKTQLLMLGVPRYEIKDRLTYRTPKNGKPLGSFWFYNEPNLRPILSIAKDCYRERIQKLHPDKGGDEEQAKNLNVIWEKVQRSFEIRGIKLN